MNLRKHPWKIELQYAYYKEIKNVKKLKKEDSRKMNYYIQKYMK